jgi:molybdate transport repressor ModE-like protein
VNGEFAIGEGGGELLRAVAAEGSLASGARRVGWSYRHAWGYVRRAEAVLGVSLLLAKSGKGKARGMLLTKEARTVVAVLLPQSRHAQSAQNTNLTAS